LHPGRTQALLDEPGLVDHEHPRSSGAELVQDIAADIVAHAFDVPVRSTQQPLHPIRRQRTGVLGQRPTVLALQPGQQPADIDPGPSPRLRPRETPPDQLRDRVQPRHPPGNIDHTVIITA